jgi:hypothetical protein
MAVFISLIRTGPLVLNQPPEAVFAPMLLVEAPHEPCVVFDPRFRTEMIGKPGTRQQISNAQPGQGGLRSPGQDVRLAVERSIRPSMPWLFRIVANSELMARLDRLGPAAQEVAQIGAALGREFTYELMDHVAARPDLDVALGQLSDAGLLFCRGVPPQSSYLFKHALVQDAAYSTLLRGRRQELHTSVAAALEEHFSDLVERQPELLAHHLTAAGNTERAHPSSGPPPGRIYNICCPALVVFWA